MQKLNIHLENCYGIRCIENEFDFTGGRTFVIYAPNGIMKTSFAKTFQDLSNDVESADRIFQKRVTKRVVTDENGTELDKSRVFVIEPYNKDYKSSKISTLLASKTLKEQYDSVYNTINEKKEILIKELKVDSGLKNGVEETLSLDFTHDDKQFFVALKRVQSEVSEEEESAFSNIQYQKIFNEKVVELLKSPEFRSSISEYIKYYDELIGSSTFFRKGIFNHNNASDIARSLKDNGFFKANHSVYVTVEGGKKEIKTEAELEEVIQHEKDTILQNVQLTKLFEEIDKKLSKNKDVKDFREYLAANKFIIAELENLDRLRQKLWISYLVKNIEAYKDLIQVYDSGKEEIEKIVSLAKDEATKWKEVIDIFNERFSVPFIVKMDNQDDVILKREAPSIKFEFNDGDKLQSAAVGEDQLLKVLSNGEKRALYILNVIFEVEARKELNQETLFIVDDIADSFDYKNKYAIIEYLKEISENEYFYQIILSHNFDFYRTVSGRFGLSRKHRFHTVKSHNAVKLISEKYQNNPFTAWKDNLSINAEMLVASIPFVRNLAEYCGFDDHYEKLTSLLHVKEDTSSLTIANLELIFKEILKDKQSLSLPDHGMLVKDLIYKLADQICQETDEVVDLEKKIVLSISIRLKAEEFMMLKINDKAFFSSIKKNQTIMLIRKYKEMFPSEVKITKLIEQVNIMTPENIHVNSFMYEPILDMSQEHLKQLYRKVTAL